MKELEENITPASIGGMGATLLPTATQTGSGDIPAKSGDAEEEYKKKKKKKKMKHLKTFESFNKINEAAVTENYEVIFSDGIEQIQKFRNERQALDFMKKEIASNKRLRDIAVYKPGMHSTTQTELVVKFWGDGSYLDNVSKRDSKLAAKKLDEAYDGAMSDFKYEFPMRFEEATGNSPKAIKRISKKGKNQYQVNTSTYMSEREMKLVADAMGMALVSYKDGGSVKVSVFESVQLDESMSSYYFDSPSEFDQFSNMAPAKGETKYLVMANNKALFNGKEIRLEGEVRFGSTSKKQILGIFEEEKEALEIYKSAMKSPQGTMVSFTMGTLVGTSKFRSQYTEIQGYLATAKVK